MTKFDNIIYVPRGGAVWLARMAHNHQVVGSNPTPATKKIDHHLMVYFLGCRIESEPTTVFSAPGRKSRRFGVVNDVKESAAGIFFYK